VPITEQQQSDSHVQLAEIAACDPDVKALLYFPLIDDTSLSGGFQSGNLFADLTHKASYAGVKAKIAASKGLCQGGVAGIPRAWSHTTSVLGAQGIFGGPGTAAGSRSTAEPPAASALRTSFTVGEDASYTARLVKVPGGPVGPALTGVAKAYYRPALRFGNLKLPNGAYQFQIVLTALTNPARTTTLTSSTFAVGGASAGGRHGRSAGGWPPRHCHGHARHGCGR
jgi:hypothetical protein